MHDSICLIENGRMDYWHLYWENYVSSPLLPTMTSRRPRKWRSSSWMGRWIRVRWSCSVRCWTMMVQWCWVTMRGSLFQRPSDSSGRWAIFSPYKCHNCTIIKWIYTQNIRWWRERGVFENISCPAGHPNFIYGLFLCKDKTSKVDTEVTHDLRLCH